MTDQAIKQNIAHPFVVVTVRADGAHGRTLRKTGRTQRRLPNADSFFPYAPAVYEVLEDAKGKEHLVMAQTGDSPLTPTRAVILPFLAALKFALGK